MRTPSSLSSLCSALRCLLNLRASSIMAVLRALLVGFQLASLPLRPSVCLVCRGGEARWGSGEWGRGGGASTGGKAVAGAGRKEKLTVADWAAA